MKTKLMALEALKLALPHINPKAIDGVRVEAEPIADCYVNTIVSATIAAIEADIAKPVKLHGWMVSGVSRVYFGDHAEMDATQEARKCGGTAKAYPIYTTPQEPAAAGWMPIETAPTGTMILMANMNAMEARSWCFVGWMVDGRVCGHRMDEPTHWMPLPAAPGGAA